jgi:hypothetical protein
MPLRVEIFFGASGFILLLGSCIIRFRLPAFFTL